MQACSGTGQDGEGGSVALGMALTVGAGLATSVGGLLPFLIRRPSPALLASGLAFAAGVMLYISLTEILQKSRQAFSCVTSHDLLFASLTFFAGTLATMSLHFLSHQLQLLEPLRRHLKRLARFARWSRDRIMGRHLHPASAPGAHASPFTSDDEDSDDDEDEADQFIPIKSDAKRDAILARSRVSSTLDGKTCGNGKEEVKEGIETEGEVDEVEEKEEEEVKKAMLEVEGHTQEEECRRLKRMGLITALAIGLHNFPEGFATLVATLSAPSLGYAVAFAVAIHNIPEGICVAMPVYYATGSKLKAAMWAFISGVSEPLGAICGYLMLRSQLDPEHEERGVDFDIGRAKHDAGDGNGPGTTSSSLSSHEGAYGIVFGLIAGMMVYITLKELLPTARRYDVDDRLVTNMMFLGMAVMAASLLLFAY